MVKIIFGFLLLIISAILNPIYADEIKINEFLANPSGSDPEWVEIYAPGQDNLNGYYLQDENDHEDNNKNKTLDNTKCPDNPDYFVFEYERDGWLNNDNDELYLYSPSDSSSPVDSYPSFGSPAEGKTIGRIQNGSGDFKVNKEPTRCAINIEAVPTPNPSPTSSPTPTPESQSTTTSTKKASPTPKTSPTPTPKVSPSPSSSPLSSPQVLGQQQDITDGFKDLANSGALNSPSPNTLTYYGSFTKNFSLILIGVGTIFVGLSFAFYMWYKKSLDKNPSINKGNDRFEEKQED